MTPRTPSIFIAHGAPPLLDIPNWVDELKAWADSMPRPTAILMLSAHWEERPVTLGATRTVPLVYDFYGFPQRYYEQQYAAPGAPQLAKRVTELLRDNQPITHAENRGLDHGAYVPLVAMYPKADIPVLQASLPTLEPKELFALGQHLKPLRDEGVLVVGSGFITHNLRTIDWKSEQATPAWASEMDAWTGDVLQRHDVDALLDYRKKAPGVAMALPTHEHFVPLIVAAGASDAHAAPKTPIDGFWLATLSRRSVQFG
jgi:4,5-DOPA dioxygenase extradiol